MLPLLTHLLLNMVRGQTPVGYFLTWDLNAAYRAGGISGNDCYQSFSVGFMWISSSPLCNWTKHCGFSNNISACLGVERAPRQILSTLVWSLRA